MPDAVPALTDPPSLDTRAERALSWRSMAGPIGLSLAALAGAFWLVYEPGAFDEMARRVRPGVLALAPLALMGQVGFNALRLRLIAHGAIPLGRALRAMTAWEFLSAVTPAAIGGAPLAAYFIAKDNRMPVGQATSLTLFSMLMDQVWFATLIPLVFLAMRFTDVFPPSLGVVGAGAFSLYLVLMLGWVGFFAYATVVRPEVLERVAGWLTQRRGLRRFGPRVMSEMGKMKAQAAVLRGQPLTFYLAGWALSAGAWLSRYSVLLLIALSVAPGLDAFAFVVRTAALWLGALAMPTPGGAGGIEGLYLVFLAPLLPDEMAGPVLLTWRGLSYYALAGLGMAVTVSALGRAARERLATDDPVAAGAP